MKKITLITVLAVSFMIGTIYAAEWINISGTLYYGSQPLNGMILANGQYMFTDPAGGKYELEVPLNENGEIILFGFCDGFAPFRQILTQQDAEYFEISMVPVPPDSTDMGITYQLTSVISDRIKMRGRVLHEGSPLCAMMLANGQHTFSCDAEGRYELEVPLPENREITLFGFCDGFAPFRQIIKIAGSETGPDPGEDNDGDGHNVMDCDDTDASVYPGAPEICGDGIDQDCNGTDSDCETTLKGRIYDGSELFYETKSSVPVAKARVSLFPASSDNKTSAALTELLTDTDIFGNYKFPDLPAGKYNMLAEAEAYEQFTSIIKITSGENVRDVRLMPVLTCQKNDECPKNLYCAKFAEKCDGKGMCSGMSRSCDADRMPVCGCDGWTYPTECSAGAAGVNVAYKGECVAGPESGTLSGHIYDGTAECPSGKCAVSFADIIISEIPPPDSDAFPKTLRTVTYKEGFYKFQVLLAGKYRIAVRKEGYQNWEGSVRIITGEETIQDIHLFTIPAESVLRGYVYDGSVISGEICNTGIVGAEAVIFYESGSSDCRHTVTDNDGYYEFADLPVGEHTISMEAEGYQYWKDIVKITGRENLLDVYLMP